MNSIESSICDAIEIIVDRAISQASYDKTIQAVVIECVDQTIGKYTCQYQDSTFYAFSGSSDLTYTNGSTVYVLIPGNDMSADKTILGTTKKLGINYIATTEPDETYQIIGNSVIIPSSKTFGLRSYRASKQVQTLYSKSYNSSQNAININRTSINEYIRNKKNIICSITVRTDLPAEQQFRGNYGIIFALNFRDNTGNSTITRYYTVDVDKMSGNPYKILYDTRQYGIFDIDGENFIEIDSISIFCYGFPNSKPDNQCIDDIFIKNIELCGAERLKDDDINNYSLTFYTPQGVYFDGVSPASDYKTVQAQVRVKGKVVDPESQKLSFYWFMEHVGITSNDMYYNKYGGQGWKCLNNYTVVKKATSTDPNVVEWIPATDTFRINKSDVIAKEVQYKCAVVYDGTVIEKTIIIKNLASGYDITITSSEGTKFYFDIGYPTLKCLVNGREQSNYNYSWAVVNGAGNFETISETPEENSAYLRAVNNYNTLLNNIQREAVPYEPNKNQLENYKAELDRYNKITRVEKNTIWHLNVSTITDFSTFKCSVFQGSAYLGTASITLINSLTDEGNYSMVINNGSYVFKYDENGVSPSSTAIDSPIEIKALTFTVYDNLGNKIDDDIIRHSSIQWIVPIKNTLIQIPDSYTNYEEDSDAGIRKYKNLMSFTYQIANRYDITKNNNDIKLLVKYKDINLSASTDLVFTKEGDEGTNGTEFFCRIVPNVPTNHQMPSRPILTELSNGSWSLNYTTQQSNRFFRAQLWHNENKIFDSVVSANSTEGKYVTVKWSILKNKYTSSILDPSALSVNESTGVFSYSGYRNDSPAHIVKIELVYDKVVYYATLPLITVKVWNNNYRVVLKDGTGFINAVYSSDGKTPRYDNTNPFELTVIQKISGYDEDISLKKTSAYLVNYTWSYLGRIYERSWITSHFLGDRLVNNLTENQKAVKPLDDYDGQCVTNAIEGVVTKSGAEIARIHIPVHLMLNRYGNSAINGWDGNSVNIDANGGFILAPQVGAGIKENDNSFTGVIIGKVKETNQSGDDIGLIGYARGVRSIFLDSRTGKAVFGANGKGQITIDPTQNTARIYSGNFVYNNNGSGTGMEIDLTTPCIRFGSGRFEVSKEGYLTAKGGGSIAGWHITNYELYSPSPYGSRKITLDSSNLKIYSNTKTAANDTKNGFYLDDNNFVLGSKFKAMSDGKLFIGTGATANSGNSYWTIDGSSNRSYISYGGTTFSGANSDSNTTAKIYMGTDGFSFGERFSITPSGEITTYKGIIGGWSITKSVIESGNIKIKSTGSIEAAGDKGSWYIRNNGSASFTNVTITGGSIEIRDANGNVNFRVDTDGSLRANKGYFKGTIEASTMNSSTIEASHIEASTMNSSTVKASNIEASTMTSSTIKASHIEASTMNSSTVKASNIEASTMTSSTIKASHIEATSMKASTIEASEIIGDGVYNDFFNIDDDYINLGDFYISSDGTNELSSSNGYITINCAGGPLDSEIGIITVSNNLGTSTSIMGAGISTPEVTVKTKHWSAAEYGNQLGKIVDSIWDHNDWGLEYLSRQVYALNERCDSLQSQIDSIDTSGGDEGGEGDPW